MPDFTHELPVRCVKIWPGGSKRPEFTIPLVPPAAPVYCRCLAASCALRSKREYLKGRSLEQRRTDAEVALELMRLVLDQAGSRRLSPTRTLALYHLCKEAVAYAPEGTVTASYLEDQLKKLLQ